MPDKNAQRQARRNQANSRECASAMLQVEAFFRRVSAREAHSKKVFSVVCLGIPQIPFRHYMSLGGFPWGRCRRGRSEIPHLCSTLQSLSRVLQEARSQKAADVCKKDVWDFQVFSQTFFELRFSLGNEGKDGKNLNSQTWPGTPRRPSSRHPRPSYEEKRSKTSEKNNENAKNKERERSSDPIYINPIKNLPSQAI